MAGEKGQAVQIQADRVPSFEPLQGSNVRAQSNIWRAQGFPAVTLEARDSTGRGR